MSGDMSQRDTLRAFAQSDRLGRLLGTITCGSIEIRALLSHRKGEMSQFVRYALNQLALQFEHAEQMERDADKLKGWSLPAGAFEQAKAGSEYLNRKLRPMAEVVALRAGAKPRPVGSVR